MSVAAPRALGVGIEEEELAGRCGEVEELLAFGDPPEPDGDQPESSADSPDPGFHQVVCEEKVLGGSGGESDPGAVLPARELLE